MSAKSTSETEEGGSVPVPVRQCGSSRRAWLQWASVSASAPLFACIAQQQSAPREQAAYDPNRRVSLEVWAFFNPFTPPNDERVNQLTAEFVRAHPLWDLTWAQGPGRGTAEKLVTAITAGNPPDVTWVDGPAVAAWAENGILQPLDEHFKRSNVTEKDFWAPSWRQNVYKGKIWAITWISDANFAFFWNKLTFAEAGVDPERPPQTVDEMDRIHERLVRQEGGQITRMGIIPWTVYGATNSIFTWGWVFGGDFYDEKNRKITANHPLVVRALEWMSGYARRHDIVQIKAFQATLGSRENAPFYVGKIGMMLGHNGELANIERWAPSLQYGMTHIPAGPPPARPKASWVGGWCIGIPQGAKKAPDSWEFLRWLCASPEGTRATGELWNWMPGWIHSPWYEKVRQDPKFGIFYEILKEARHQRPVLPVTDFYWMKLEEAVNAAINGEKTPRQALDDITPEVQRELDRVMK